MTLMPLFVCTDGQCAYGWRDEDGAAHDFVLQDGEIVHEFHRGYPPNLSNPQRLARTEEAQQRALTMVYET